MKKNKIIITVILAIAAIIAISYIFSESNWLSGLGFRYIQNSETGEAANLFESIIIYGFYWWLCGTFLSCFLFLIFEIVYAILHRREGGFPRPEGSDFYYGGAIAFAFGFLVITIVVLFHMFGLITVHF